MAFQVLATATMTTILRGLDLIPDSVMRINRSLALGSFAVFAHVPMNRDYLWYDQVKRRVEPNLKTPPIWSMDSL